MKITDNEILFIYNSEDIRDREALGYAKAVPGHTIKEFDLSKESLTSLNLKRLAQRYDFDIHDLLNSKSDKYKKYLKGSSLSEDELLDFLINNPKIFRTPLIFYQDSASAHDTPYEMVPEGLEWTGIELKKVER